MLILDHYCQTCSEISMINPISSPRDIGADAHSSVSRGSGRDLNHWLRIWVLHWWHVLFSCDSWSLNIVVQSSYHLLFILRLPSWYCFRFVLSLSLFRSLSSSFRCSPVTILNSHLHFVYLLLYNCPPSDFGKSDQGHDSFFVLGPQPPLSCPQSYLHRHSPSVQSQRPCASRSVRFDQHVLSCCLPRPVDLTRVDQPTIGLVCD